MCLDFFKDISIGHILNFACDMKYMVTSMQSLDFLGFMCFKFNVLGKIICLSIEENCFLFG